MNRDPDAYKADIEERDRIKRLAADARAILNKLEDRDEWPHAALVHCLMSRGFSWREASDALEYIDWEDNRYDGESC